MHAHIQYLNKIFEDSCSDPETVIVISNASINRVTTLILYVYSGHNIHAKTIHYAVNITTTKT